ncbi:alpha/beta hydrolase [Phragmitibacter flavus]|uniref:Alpha/beta hydrolase n=2 Tax=Phragmitibacter flavus TaxID=2576071 RepID=A0A5R8KM19_9BACT|nr:alpha/beta hydrolase [Phragmitibacter flavus]
MIYKLTHPTISPTNPKSLSGVYLDYQMVDATDTDLDGIPDRIEQWYAANGEPMDYTNPADGGGDLDGDRINNRTAYEQGWSLIAYRGQYDSDLDRMTDAQEDYWSSIYPGSFNKNRFADAVEDYDQDGLFNYEELEQNLDPGNPHSKFTGITDGQYAAWQRAIGTPGYYGYLDGQPISTPPSHGEQADWDGDGIPEGYAAFVNDGHTVPNGPTHPVDQDNDGMSNEWEHRHQFEPRDSRDAGPATGFVVATEPTEGRNESTESEWQAYELAVLGDFDRDGLSNLREFLLGTHPKIADTDGDGINDGTEVQAGSNPTDINSEPTTVTPITPPRINLELSGIHLQGGTGSGNSGTGGGNSGGGSGNGSGNNNGPQPTEEELDNATRLTPFIVQYSGWKGGSISSAGGSYSPGTPEGVGMRPVASTAPSTPSTYTGYIQKYRYKQQGANDAPTPEPVGDPIEHAGLSGDSAAWITANSTPQPAYHIIKTSVEAQRELDGRFIQAHKILITTDSFNAPVNTQQEAIDEATYQNLNRNPEPTKYALGPVTTWQSAYTGGGPVENPEPGEPAMEEYIIEAVPEQNHPPTHTYTSPTPGWYGNLLSYPVQSQSEEHQGESVNLSPKLETLPNGDFFIKSVPIKWNGGPVAVAKNRLEEREIQYTGPGGEQTMTGYFGTAQHGKVRVIWTSEWGGMLDETTKAAWQSRYLVALVDVTEPHDQSGPQTIEYKWVKSLKEFMAQSQPTEIKAPAPFAAMLKSQALVLLPVELLVDHNRDGELNTSDNPTEEKPFRFWINNDDDPESNDELDDEPVAVSASNGGIHSPHIDGIRDLEDFTRLHLNVESILEMLKSGDMELGFKFVEGDGSPLIRIFNAVDFEEGSESYLKDKDKATEQCTGEFRQKLLSVGRYSQEYLPKTFWQSEKGNRPVAHFIWEASAKGKAKLVVMFRNKSGTESEACGVWLKLMDVHEMYQRARITAEPEEIDDPWDDDRPDALQWVWDPNGNPHVEDPDVEEKTLIFVHGWRMTYHDYDSWGQTTFKRLWQMGYKGRFYTFRWPTHSGDNDGLPDIYKPGATTYNPSEYRAWLSGPALANFVNQLPNANNRCLFAHSMGNVITGSALRNGMNLTRYALCNAAMAAQAYGDETVDFNFTTPDTDPDQSTKDQFGITDKFFEATPKTNFFLETDSALAVWETNNQLFKPNEFIIHAYAYRPGFPVGEKLIYGVVGASLASSRIVTQLSEAMGYVTKSRTKAAGTRACTTNTCITSAVNMGVGGFNFGDEHSAQWVYSIQKNYYFWLDIVTKFGFGIGNREP